MYNTLSDYILICIEIPSLYGQINMVKNQSSELKEYTNKY